MTFCTKCGKKNNDDSEFCNKCGVRLESQDKDNSIKKHAKKKDEKNPGGILDIPRPLAVSKIALLCKSCGKKTRAGYVITKSGKERVCRKCQQKI